MVSGPGSKEEEIGRRKSRWTVPLAKVFFLEKDLPPVVTAQEQSGRPACSAGHCHTSAGAPAAALAVSHQQSCRQNIFFKIT